MVRRLKKERMFEILSYFFWGGTSVMVNIGCFELLLFLHIDYRIANIITLVVLKFYVFATNKMLVFKTKTENVRQLGQEFLRFLGSRLFTNLIDYFGLIVLVEYFYLNRSYGKVAVAVIVIALNYVFSKKIVFKRRG